MKMEYLSCDDPIPDYNVPQERERENLSYSDDDMVSAGDGNLVSQTNNNE